MVTVTAPPLPAAAGFASSAKRQPIGAFDGSLRKRMPFSLQEAAMKMFSSVIGRPASSSAFFATAPPFFGSASFSSRTVLVVGTLYAFVSSFDAMNSLAFFTISGSGGTGVLPK